MGGGKETPRQKMIGMMYLVLTALLAMNVSKDILNAFVVVNSGLQKTTDNFGQKNTKTYADFAAANAKDPAKTKAYYDKAMTAKKMSDDLDKYIDNLKKEVIMKTDGKDEKAADSLKVKLQFVEQKDNYDMPTEIMIGSDPAKPKEGPFTAMELKKKIDDLRVGYMKLFDDSKLFLPKDKAEMEAKIGLRTEKVQVAGDGSTEEWVNGNFYHLPLAAVITNLSKIQADVKNAEADVVNKLLAAVKGKDFTFDKLVAKVIAPSSYILQGDEYKADVLLVAFNSTQNPEIILGAVDTSKAKDENVNPLSGAEGEKLPVEGGMGKYVRSASAEGLQKWSGVIKVEKPGGGYNYYPFMSEYMVAKPALVVSPTKMNVLYIGVDNPIDISVPGVPAENLSPSLSGGSLTGGKGKYVARVTGGSEATVNVSAKLGGTSKSMGSFKFRVKRIPDPVSYVAGKKGSDIISKGELQAIQGVVPKLENFDFDLTFQVTSFTMSMMLKGILVEFQSNSNRLTPEMASALKSAGTGTKVFFEYVKAKGPDGTTRTIPGVSLKVK